MHCSKNGTTKSEHLPLCQNTLNLHILRSNYQLKIWRQAMVANPDYGDIRKHGWNIVGQAVKKSLYDLSTSSI